MYFSYFCQYQITDTLHVELVLLGLGLYYLLHCDVNAQDIQRHFLTTDNNYHHIWPKDQAHLKEYYEIVSEARPLSEFPTTDADYFFLQKGTSNHDTNQASSFLKRRTKFTHVMSLKEKCPADE